MAALSLYCLETSCMTIPLAVVVSERKSKDCKDVSNLLFCRRISQYRRWSDTAPLHIHALVVWPEPTPLGQRQTPR